VLIGRRAKGNGNPIEFSRRYLDPSDITYAVSAYILVSSVYSAFRTIL
jgi:hypothetical protein